MQSIPDQDALIGGINHLCLISQTGKVERPIEVDHDVLASPTTISCLPPEILSRIFLNLRYPTDLSCFRVGLVCRYWRSVALGYPELWVNISNHYKADITKIMLARSKDLPLTICLDQNGHCSTPMEEIFGQAHRIRSLTMDAFWVVACDPGVWPFPIKAPILEELSMTSHVLVYIPDLFGEDCPSLRVLNLSNCGFAWNKGPFTPALKVLHLQREGGMRRYSPSFSLQHILDALRAAPSIERICLQEYLHISSTQQISSISPVPLPELQSLTLVDSIQAITDVLGVIRVPRASSICADVSRAIPTIEHMTQLLSSIKVSWPIHLSGVQSLSATEDGSTLTFWLEFTLSEGPPSDSKPPCLSVSLHQSLRVSVVAALISAIESFDMRNLLFFHISTTHKSESIKRLIQALSRLPMLEKMSLEGCEDSFRHFVDTLGDNLREDVPFPRLSEIECRRMVLQQRDPMASFTRLMGQQRPLPPIKVLRMHQCSFSRETLLQSRAALPRLIISS
ncbi:hypothetical protein NMY22_g11546 [Coprinellus aureogranulatus]|nr:hypothetical protein NMY22_g11546 [Coprinellus aureogranulatus]